MKRWPVALAAATLFWTLATQRSAAQGDQSYLALIDSYARGQITEAVKALSAWPQARVRAAVQTLDTQTAVDRRQPAIMLHTEAAFNEVVDGRESFHVDVARSFLGRLLNERAGRGVRDFGARWHALAGILYCVRDDGLRARTEVNRGLTLDSNHKDVNLVSGALIEHQLRRQVSNLRGGHPDPDTPEIAERRNKMLAEATVKYRSIVSNHPDFLEARLRLGWVLHLNDSHERGREQLEEVTARATRPELLYLAHLFLGSVHEQANRLSEAAREYEAARDVAPMQSSVIGLIRIELQLGHDDRARALTADIPTARSLGTFDLWHSYSELCFSSGGLIDGLRAEAQRQ